MVQVTVTSWPATMGLGLTVSEPPVRVTARAREADRAKKSPAAIARDFAPRSFMSVVAQPFAPEVKAQVGQVELAGLLGLGPDDLAAALEGSIRVGRDRGPEADRARCARGRRGQGPGHHPARSRAAAAAKAAHAAAHIGQG